MLYVTLCRCREKTHARTHAHTLALRPLPFHVCAVCMCRRAYARIFTLSHSIAATAPRTIRHSDKRPIKTIEDGLFCQSYTQNAVKRHFIHTYTKKHNKDSRHDFHENPKITKCLGQINSHFAAKLIEHLQCSPLAAVWRTFCAIKCQVSMDNRWFDAE